MMAPIHPLWKLAVITAMCVAGWAALVALAVAVWLWPKVAIATLGGFAVGFGLAFLAMRGRELDVDGAHTRTETFANTSFSNAFAAQEAEQAVAELERKLRPIEPMPRLPRRKTL